MKLEKTAQLMLSDEYEERFIAEYWQLKHRLDRLMKKIVSYEIETKSRSLFMLDLYKKQAEYMRMYLHVLELRAELEKINLS